MKCSVKSFKRRFNLLYFSVFWEAILIPRSVASGIPIDEEAVLSELPFQPGAKIDFSLAKIPDFVGGGSGPDLRGPHAFGFSRPSAGTWWRSFRIPYSAVGHVSASIDGLLIIISSVCGGFAYQLFSNGSLRNAAEPLVGAGVIGALLYVLIGYASGFYELRAILAKRKDAGRVFGQWSLVSLLLTLMAFLMKIGPVFSRGSIFCYGLLALVLLVMSRRLSRREIRTAISDGRLQGRRAIMLGTQAELASMGASDLLGRFGLTKVDEVAFSNDENDRLALTSYELSSLNRALALANEREINEIVLAFPWNEARRLELIRERLRCSPLPVQLLPDRRVRSLVENPSFRVRNSLSIEVQRSPLSRGEQSLKRSLDVLCASIVLMALLPMMLMTALAIKIDSPGPVFFRQRRRGFNANQFAIFKFRSMRVMEDGAAVKQATRLDSRVTRVGQLLRRTSIDELPQLINVLRGDMSLVGPRPHALAHDDYYGNLLSDYAFRHHVKPGITGWAQVRGYRGETERVEQMKGRVDCDLWYINNWSWVLDFKILVMTVFAVVRQKNAY